jgi:hypothetical protein
MAAEKTTSRQRKLKVFRTPVGFHDAYVAAPSQKAALEAWGADSNLFAQGVAEQVSDPDLIAEPLARPGAVIRRLRGSREQQIEALGRTATSKLRASKPQGAPSATPKRPAKPSRADLSEAEERLSAAEAEHRRQMRDLQSRERKLTAERRALERAQREDRKRLKAGISEAREQFQRALAEWKKG